MLCRPGYNNKSKSFYNPLDHLLNTTLLHIQKQSHSCSFLLSSKSKLHSKLAKSLLQYHNSIPPPRIATFYTIPKIHKTLIPPISGRLIVSSNGTITFHTSVYLDIELQPVLKLLKTICTSSRHIIQHMTRTKFPVHSIILGADKLNFIMELLRWVLLNNCCSFNDIIYLQKKGTAMRLFLYVK
jgi:hypothetical protein